MGINNTWKFIHMTAGLLIIMITVSIFKPSQGEDIHSTPCFLQKYINSMALTKSCCGIPICGLAASGVLGVLALCTASNAILE